MAEAKRNRVRDERMRRGWSQERLAEQAGLSRAEVSAVETGRVVPSVAGGLALAGALECTVEQLFGVRLSESRAGHAWAWPPGRERRYWLASAGGRVLRYPVEATAVGVLPHDGVEGGRAREGGGMPEADPARTLVVAGCDPAIGLLVSALARARVRLLPLLRSSGRALGLLQQGLVHVAGVHLGDERAGNARVVRAALGPDHRRVHVARWTEGLALAPGLRHRTIASAVRARLRWVGREEGSGARRCMDLILQGRRPTPEGCAYTASDHRGVVETIRTGWAQAGVCVQLVAAEGGLDFLPARREDYDLCFPAELEDDARVLALVDAMRSQAFVRVLRGLPGYDVRHTGELA
jgi:molybdate-binding protein/transcriptional regulator with XRE-family HTH domain